MPILTVITFLPLAGALALLFLPKDRKGWLYGFAVGSAALAFLASLAMYAAFDARAAGPQFVEQASWLGLGIQYHLGIDGISLWLVLLTTFLFPLAILSSWSAIGARIKEYLIFLLVLETGILGVFLALNLFLFYVFWEAMLIPMYFLIGMWGGRRRIYATMKFVLVTMFGSLLMLVAIFVMAQLFYRQTGGYSLNVLDFYGLAIPPHVQTWLFLAFGLAFAIKVPMFPFHTWLPDAHVEAPTAGSVILAALLLKMGAYGFLRFALPLFPDAADRFLPALSILALIGIIYGGAMALVQKDVKSLVAYSSVSHMGLVMLAIFALNVEGTQGAIYQMLNHGLSTGALFLAVGVLYERAHTRQIGDFGGVAKQMPVFWAFFLLAVLSSVGLPGLNGFVGEITSLFGIFAANKVYAYLAVSTVILGAAYLLWMFQRVMHGPITNDRILSFKDMNKRELAVFIPIIILMFWMGIYPSTFMRKMDASIASYLQLVKSKQKVMVHRSAVPPAAVSVRTREIPGR
jgi:NADH-quinone oxidoreductase subunit M